MNAYRIISPSDCEGCPASRIPLLGGDSNSRRALCLTHFRLAAFDARATVYDIGSPGEALFVLRRGLVKLVRHAPDGTERIVRLKRPGDSFGLESLLGRNYRHRAAAATACEVCRLPANTLLSLGSSNPAVRQSLLDQYEKSIETADAFLADLSTGSAHERVARLLLFLADGSTEAEFPLLSREDMGAVLDIATETASRIMAEFRRKGLVDLPGEHLCRCDQEGLAAIAGM